MMPQGVCSRKAQLTKQDVLEHKIVYSYDSAGKQTGYAVYDSAGKLLGQTTPTSAASVPAKKKAK